MTLSYNASELCKIHTTSNFLTKHISTFLGLLIAVFGGALVNCYCCYLPLLESYRVIKAIDRRICGFQMRLQLTFCQW